MSMCDVMLHAWRLDMYGFTGGYTESSTSVFVVWCAPAGCFCCMLAQLCTSVVPALLQVAKLCRVIHCVALGSCVGRNIFRLWAWVAGVGDKNEGGAAQLSTLRGPDMVPACQATGVVLLTAGLPACS